MPDKPTLVLDSAGIKSFIEHDLSDFIKDLADLFEDNPNGVRSLQSLLDGRTTADNLQQNLILAIGPMAQDDSVHGKALLEKTTAAAKAINDVLTSQRTLFKDIDSALRKTVDTLLKIQGENLAGIDGDKLLDIFTNVEADLGKGSGSVK